MLDTKTCYRSVAEASKTGLDLDLSVVVVVVAPASGSLGVTPFGTGLEKTGFRSAWENRSSVSGNWAQLESFLTHFSRSGFSYANKS